MNMEKILSVFREFKVDYILIGGMNFFLRHQAVMTYDVDLWIADTPDNLARCEQALAALDASWGESDETWGLVAKRRSGWLTRQDVFSLSSPYGAIDIFRAVKGLSDWSTARAQATEARTADGTLFFSLSDADMLKCQEALDPNEQKTARMEVLRKAMKEKHGSA